MGEVIKLGLIYAIGLGVSPLIGAAMLEWGVRRVGLKPLPFSDCWKAYLASTCYVLLASIALNFALSPFDASISRWVMQAVHWGILGVIFMAALPLLAKRREPRFWAVSAVVIVANTALMYLMFALIPSMASEEPARQEKSPATTVTELEKVGEGRAIHRC